MRCYAPRPIEFIDLLEHDGWRLKRYQISVDDQPVDWSSFEPGLTQALASLPHPAVTTERAGVGFVILHHGNGVDYLVLCWWDRENELPMSVHVRERHSGAEWRKARGSESVCVWDLQVIAFERDAYVATLLAPAGDVGDPRSRADAYLRAVRTADVPT